MDNETIHVADAESISDVVDAEAIKVIDAVTVAIIKRLTAVSVGPPTPTAAFAGQQVTLTANLTTNFIRGLAPGGTVSFFDGSVPLGPPAPVLSSTGTGTPSATASFMTSALPAGSHSITAQYSGDANYQGGTSPQPWSITINKSLTTLDISSPPLPSSALAAQQVTFTEILNVTSTGPGVPAPGGTVTFFDGSVPLEPPAPVVSSTGTGTPSAAASFMTSALPAGSHTITAQYSGDANYQGSTSIHQWQITINKSHTGLVIGPPTPDLALAGQQVTFTASLSTDFLGGPALGGTVTFFDGSVPLVPPAPVVSSTVAGTPTGTVNFMTSALAAPGLHLITAQYSGDPNYLGSMSNEWTIALNNTPPGMGVAVTPTVIGGGSSPVSLVFTNVTGHGGVTSLSISNTGPPPLNGFQLGNPPVYYNLTTTATFTGNVTICINYSGITFTQPPQLFHIVGGTPVNITTSVDTTNMIVCGVTTSFSPFALFAPLPVLTITAKSVPRQYGQANPALNNVTYSGFVNGETSSVLSGTLSCVSSAAPATPVGTYPITCSGLSSANYTINFVPGTLTITAVPLTITANNRSKTYGQTVAFAGTEFAASGLLNGDTVTSVTLTSAGAAPSASVAGSPYPITPSAAVGTGLGNYTISYVNGTLTVTPALLTITANNATKILNAPNPSPLGWTATGFANGENTSVLTANPSCTTTATTTSPVGSYPITCSGANAANYTLSYVAGTLKIQYATSVGHVIQPPINSDGTSVFNQGRTIPAKFNVYDANGVSIGTPGVVSSFFLTGIVSGTVAATVENVVDTNNPDTAFRWDGQEWIFNITTANLSAGSTYIYTVTLNDGSTIMFQYGLR